VANGNESAFRRTTARLKLNASTPLVHYSPCFLVDLLAQPDAGAASILIDELDAAPIQRVRESFSPFRLVAQIPIRRGRSGRLRFERIGFVLQRRGRK
jgi:hypothetical protein